jgi:hypothetical protein
MINRVESRSLNNIQIRMKAEFLKAKIYQETNNKEKFEKSMDLVLGNISEASNDKDLNQEKNDLKTISSFAEISDIINNKDRDNKELREDNYEE